MPTANLVASRFAARSFVGYTEFVPVDSTCMTNKKSYALALFRSHAADFPDSIEQYYQYSYLRKRGVFQIGCRETSFVCNKA